MSSEQLKFGTSGLRGPVVAFRPEDCFAYGVSFAKLLREKFPQCQKVSLAGDLRASTPMISDYFVQALKSQNFEVENLGTIPTPTLAYWALQKGLASVMVTGSHIPADQNGVKFYTPIGEITKEDEVYIHSKFQESDSTSAISSHYEKLSLKQISSQQKQAEDFYKSRYVDFFGKDVLSGMRIAFYQHSGVGRDILPEVLKSMGAQVECFGWSSDFIPVDTENVQNISSLRKKLTEMKADVLFSTDGDADRPLVIDAKYGLVRGDVLGIITSQLLNIKSIATPVSSTSLIEQIGYFDRIERTKIGSPYVISGLEKLMSQSKGPWAGFEANGGYLLAGEVKSQSGGALSPLMTRDCFLPIVAFAVARLQSRLESLFQSFGSKTNLSGLVPHFPREVSVQLIKALKDQATQFLGQDHVLLENFGNPRSVDSVDGIKILSHHMETVHFRPSGNAPEFRVYVEANDSKRAEEFLERSLKLCQLYLASNLGR